MKIMLLSDANSPHTIKWVKGLIREGLTIGLWSISKPNPGIYENMDGLKIYHSEVTQEKFSIIAKMKYLTALANLRQAIQDFKPDVLHAHFASSYGLLGALTKFKPFIISVWGDDVFFFPNRNFIFKRILKYNLFAANKILSTSEVMAVETSKYTNKDIVVTPFGIDLEIFKNLKVDKEDKAFTVGTIKTLEEKYGVAYLIDAFKIFHDKYPMAKLKLLIVGGGSLEHKLKMKVHKFGISELCEFTGQVSYENVPYYHNQLDVCLCLSIYNSESFGVAAIEASASERPVIVSEVGGLPEVIEDQVTGIVVPPKNAEDAAEAMEKLYLDKELRISMGKAGRKRVQQKYDWNQNLKQVTSIYKEMLSHGHNA